MLSKNLTHSLAEIRWSYKHCSSMQQDFVRFGFSIHSIPVLLRNLEFRLEVSKKLAFSRPKNIIITRVY